MTTSIETASGLYLDYVNPRPEQIRVEDIARALSHEPRFGGHTTKFYSVAQHSMRVMQLVVSHFKVPSLALAALHHDSHEAYTKDIPSPLKSLLGEPYREIVERIDAVIADVLGIWVKDLKHPVVKQADELAMRIEAMHLKESRGLGDHWGRDELPSAPVWFHVFVEPTPERFLEAHRWAQELQR